MAPATTRTFLPPAATLRHANARFLGRFAFFADFMLTLTFKPDRFGDLPTERELHRQLRHMISCWDTHRWKNRMRFNPKCQVLFLPVVEGAQGQKRIHAHILVGNVGDEKAVRLFVEHYIDKKAKLVADRYDIKSIYAADGMAWYLTKETDNWNDGAVAWEIASIPPALWPKQ